MSSDASSSDVVARSAKPDEAVESGRLPAGTARGSREGGRVWVRALRLEDFRNYDRLQLDLERGLNFFVGPNGSGKTSVLEAVSYLSVARSLRGASDNEVVRWGRSGFGVGADCGGEGSSRTIVLRYEKGAGKSVTIDGEAVGRLADLLGIVRVAWFSPEDTWITKGGPGERRRFLDMALCQLDPVYLNELSSYRRALRQRNEALLSWAPDEESDRIVNVWTERLKSHGSVVIARRLGFLPRLRDEVARFHREISGGGDEIDIRYRSGALERCGGESGDAALEETAERFERALAAVEADERRRGFTLVGPHRDDLEVRLSGRVLRTFGSQGQHRTAAIALKLGEASVLDAGGGGVVVLLDDILSELDDERGSALVGIVSEFGQALVTSTREGPPEMRRAATFRVTAGEVARA